MYKFDELEECPKCGTSFWTFDNYSFGTAMGTTKRRVNKIIEYFAHIKLRCKCGTCGFSWMEETKDAKNI